MFPRLALLPIGLFIIWCFVSQRWYVCHIKMACETSLEEGTNQTEAAADNRPLVFKWSDPVPEVRKETFDPLKSSLLAGLQDKDLLIIKGGYFASEPKPADGFANMGLARAAQLKKMFSPPLDASRIVETSYLIEPEPAGIQDRDTLFECMVFDKKEVKDSTIAEQDPEVECIKESDNKLVVLFPYGQSQREVDVKIEECLKSLIAYLKTTGKKVHIVGHTDQTGPDDFNINLGMARAEHIRSFLIKGGIPKNMISIESKGESEPVASNETEEGSRLNRRAVLTLTDN